MCVQVCFMCECVCTGMFSECVQVCCMCLCVFTCMLSVCVHVCCVLIRVCVSVYMCVECLYRYVECVCV